MMSDCAYNEDIPAPRVERAGMATAGDMRGAGSHQLLMGHLCVERSLRRTRSLGLVSGKSLPPAAADNGGAVEATAAGHGVMRSLQAAAAGVFVGGFRPHCLSQSDERPSRGCHMKGKE